jgi:DNA repair protein RadC
VEAKLRELAPAALAACRGQCAEPEAAYASPLAAPLPPGPFEEDRPLRRLLTRLGLLPRSRSAVNLYELLGRMAQATGERAATLQRVLDLYCSPADGVPLVLCGDEPRCEACPLAPDCKHYQRTPTIPDLPPDQRPRERLIAEGERALADAELLAILLRTGTEQDTAIALAQKLLAKFGSFRALATRTVAELSAVKGVGLAKVAQIKAAVEIGRRAAAEQAAEPGRVLSHSGTVFEMYGPRLRDLKKETFLALLLDAKNRVFQEVAISEGSLTASIVHPREVFHEAIRHQAVALVCVHNHPSGDPAPSDRDLDITRRLAETGKVLGIQLLDHIIVADRTYYSFADQGRLPTEQRHEG